MLRKEGEEGRNQNKKDIDNIKESIETIKKNDETQTNEIEKIEKDIVNLEETWKEREGIKEKDWETKFQNLQKLIENKPAESNKQIVKEIVNSEISTRKEIEEREERRNNIVIAGFKYTKNEEKEKEEEINNFLNEIAEKQIKIKQVHEIGNERNTYTKIILEKGEDKKKIMEKRNKLKGKTVYINNDLTRKEGKIQKQLRDMARKERESGKKARAGYMKIWVEDKKYIWSEEEDKLLESNDHVTRPNEQPGPSNETVF